jgi:hypothetical protein
LLKSTYTYKQSPLSAHKLVPRPSHRIQPIQHPKTSNHRPVVQTIGAKCLESREQYRLCVRMMRCLMRFLLSESISDCSPDERCRILEGYAYLLEDSRYRSVTQMRSSLLESIASYPLAFAISFKTLDRSHAWRKSRDSMSEITTAGMHSEELKVSPTWALTVIESLERTIWSFLKAGKQGLQSKGRSTIWLNSQMNVSE